MTKCRVRLSTHRKKIRKHNMELLNEQVNPKKAPLWLLSLVVVMPTFFAFLATSATNVALRHILRAHSVLQLMRQNGLLQAI